MRTIALILILFAAVSLGEESGKHSISASFVPLFLYPDIGYEYSVTSEDAIGFSTLVGVINRLTYSRKLGNFCIGGSFGYALGSLDIENASPFATFNGEHRIRLGENLYTRTIVGVFFAKNVGEGMYFVPILQLGLGYHF